MMGKPVLFLCNTFMRLLGVRVCSDLFATFINDGLFKKRPPEHNNKYQVKKKRKRQLLGRRKAISLIACLPVFAAQGREVLGQDLQAFVGRVGFLQTGQLPVELRGRLKNDLIQNPRELDGIPGLQVAVADSGASAVCMKDKSSILPGTYESLDKPINLGGIASGLAIIGNGQTSFEFISTKGKKIKMIRHVYHAPGLPVNLVPPQKLM